MDEIKTDPVEEQFDLSGLTLAERLEEELGKRGDESSLPKKGSPSKNGSKTDQQPNVSNDEIEVPVHVLETIEDLFPSSDPLDKLDFNPIEYINGIFPNQQSLTNLDDVVSKTKQRICDLDSEISSVIRTQSNIEREGRDSLNNANQVISQLKSSINEMKSQAVNSERMVEEITRDIRSLDAAKRNLTSSIVMLNNLHILVEGVERMEHDLVSTGGIHVTGTRNYGQTATILESCLEVLRQLDHHQHIPHIQSLASRVDSIRSKLSLQIMADFKTVLDGKGSQFNANQLKLLAESCLVIDCLESKVKNELVQKIISSELMEYKALFQENQDVSWLDKVDKRYNWLKKHLVGFEERFWPHLSTQMGGL